MHENLFSSSDKERFPQPQLQSFVPALSLAAGGKGGGGQAAGMPAIDVFSKGATSFLRRLKPQIRFHRFSPRLLSHTENKARPPGRG